MATTLEADTLVPSHLDIHGVPPLAVVVQELNEQQMSPDAGYDAHLQRQDLGIGLYTLTIGRAAFQRDIAGLFPSTDAQATDD